MRTAFLAIFLLAACTPKPPDVPVCEQLTQKITTNAEGHTLLTPSSACMINLGEAECGHCVWIVSGQERFIGEIHKMVALQSLVQTGKKDAKGNSILDWEIEKDPATGKPIMVSTWLNDKKSWNQVKKESAYLPGIEAYSPLASYIINSCKKMNCEDSVSAFRVKLDSLNGISSLMGAP